MKTIELSTASKPLSDYALYFNEDAVVLTLNGKAIAVVIALNEEDRESVALSMNPEFNEIIEKAREEFKQGKKLSLEEMK